MEQIHLHPVMIDILKKRGFDTEEKIREYLAPAPQLTYDPFLMKNMDPVCDRILKAVDENEKICIYGDYDVDGVTSVTLLLEYLRQLTNNIMFYIPSRKEEGYGLNDRASEIIANEGVSLIITVDCGCTARQEVEYIKKLGMSIIITDHHTVDPSRTPDCLMLDTKQPGETYPFHHLCGCGVAFKIAQAICIKRNLPKKNLNRCLDLVGIATVADVVPLTDENRTLVKYGIDRIRKKERLGLNALLRTSRIRPETLTAYNIAFGIAPRINSAGRLSTADHGVHLFSAKDDSEADSGAKTLEQLNQLRKSIQDRIYAEALRTIDLEQPDDPLLLYHAGTADEGVTGIVAGKLREHYLRPVIVVSHSREKGFLKGTGRSVNRLDLFRLLNNHVEIFERFGGHPGACGFTIKENNLETLRNLLRQDMKEILQNHPFLFEENLDIDALITPNQISMELARQIQSMEPFGKENECPLFEIINLHVLKVFSMGAKKQYRKFQFRTAEEIAYAVAFDTEMPGLYEVQAGDTIRVFAEISINTWNGNSSVQLMIKKII